MGEFAVAAHPAADRVVDPGIDRPQDLEEHVEGLLLLFRGAVDLHHLQPWLLQLHEELELNPRGQGEAEFPGGKLVEECRCVDSPPVKLMTAPSDNPVCCVACNLEVSANRLAEVPEKTLVAVSYWARLYEGIHLLWLDSGAYEEWAGEQLSDIASPINIMGLDAAPT